MKKSLNKFLDKLIQKSERTSLLNSGQSVELVSEEEACAVRGGDKEYKPIYDEEDDQKHQWKRPSIFFNFFDSISNF